MAKARGAALHPWELTPQEAIEIQKRLAPLVETEDRFSPPATVAGADVGFLDGGRTARAAAVVLSFPDLELLEQIVVTKPVTFPYIPGLLSFREVPALLDALAQLTNQPDLILCDAQGIAHPRRFGLACHLGLCSNVPTIGVAKSRLIGSFEEPSREKGSWSPLTHKDDVIGAVLRSRAGVKPLFISSGHRISLPTAIQLTLACTPKYRLPETTRLADRLASNRLKTSRQKHLQASKSSVHPSKTDDS